MNSRVHNQVIIPEEYRDKPFTVDAGNYDSDGSYDSSFRNSKYCDSFATLPEALADWERVSDYPWAVINYTAPDGRLFDITPQPILQD